LNLLENFYFDTNHLLAGKIFDRDGGFELLQEKRKFDRNR